MSLSAMGGGAADGLKDFLLQMLREEQTREVSRHNTAEEGLRGREINVNEGIRNAQLQNAKAAADRLQMDRENQERNRTRDDKRAALDDLLPGVMITPKTRNEAVESGAAAPERFKDVIPYDDDFVGPIDEKGPQRGEVGGYTLRGQTKAGGRAPELKTVLYKGKPVDANYDKDGRLIYQGRDITDEAEHYTAPSVSFVQSGDTWATGDRHSGKITPTDVPLATPSAVRTRQDLADRVGSHFDDIQKMIDEAESRGLLGPMAGRTYVDFMAGKVGTTGNAKDDELLGELRQNLSLARSGLAQLHGRGGANVGLIQGLEKNMDAGHMSYNELTGGLRAMKNWVDTYAKKREAGGETKTETKTDPGEDLYQQYLNRNQPKQ